MSEEISGAVKALRAERQIRKAAEQQRDTAREAVTAAEQGRDEALSRLDDTNRALNTARGLIAHWQQRANDRGHALTLANQTNITLNRVINERLNNE